MARKSNVFKVTERPAPRRHDYERLLCEAIQKSIHVTLRYDDDIAERTFRPFVVYRTSKKKICVFGIQVEAISTSPHNFEVGKMRSLSLTDSPFQRDPQFNVNQARYRDRLCPL